MVLSTIRMKVPPKKHAEILRILKSIAEQNRVRRGCLGCWIYEDAEEENVIMYEELWRSEEELKSRLQANDYNKLLLVAEMALQHPEIKFNTITKQSGLETIEKARGYAGVTESP